MSDNDDLAIGEHASGCTKQRARDRQATEEALLAAALAIFADKGYENASTRCIADQAGCSESLIQRYFNGKEGLLLAVLNIRNEDSRQAKFFDGPLCSSIEEEARHTFQLGIDCLEKRADKMRIVVSRALIDAAFKEDFNRVSLRSWVKTRIVTRLKAYVEAGMLPQDLDVETAAEFMMTLRFQLGFVYPTLLQHNHGEVRRMADRFAQMFAQAVMAG